jgi:hypothetical protein
MSPRKQCHLAIIRRENSPHNFNQLAIHADELFHEAERLRAALRNCVKRLEEYAEADQATQRQGSKGEVGVWSDPGEFIHGVVDQAKELLDRYEEKPQETPCLEPLEYVECQRVRLRKHLPNLDLYAGSTGTIVHVYGRGAALEVELGAGGKCPKIVTLDRDAVEPIIDR